MADDPPVPLSASVEQLRRRLGVPAADVSSRIIDAWEDLVDPVLASRSQPVSVRDGRLRVTTDDPAVAQRLRWEAQAVCDRLAALVGAGVVDALDVVMAARPPRQ